VGTGDSPVRQHPRTRAAPWKSGASAPCKVCKIKTGFSPSSRPSSGSQRFPDNATTNRSRLHLGRNLFATCSQA
jgi:hypothetical protein